MKRRMTLQFFPDEYTKTGVALVMLEYADEAQAGPYIDFTMLVPYSSPELGLDDSSEGFMTALMSDLQKASNKSPDDALLLLQQLEAINFGPIRCLSA